ncbi:MAG: LLM class flavin-dependent oxidoreductase [Thermomicrobiales bacterium]
MNQTTPLRMKIGIILPLGEGMMEGASPRWHGSPSDRSTSLLAMTRRIEELGYDSIWVVDHLVIERAGGEKSGVWECWSLVSAIAAITTRVEIGTLVLSNSFRNPALVAKMADTVDEISDGRLILGIGAGWHEPEYKAFGFPYDHRASRFEEGVQIIHGLLKHGQIDFDGRYYQVRDCELRPRGPRPNGPPIMIGTSGPRMLQLTAQYADSWNVYFDKTDNRPESLTPLNAQLDAACHDLSRDPKTLERTASVAIGVDGRSRAHNVAPQLITGSLDQIASELRRYAGHGITHLQIRVEPNTLASIEQLAPVLDML